MNLNIWNNGKYKYLLRAIAAFALFAGLTLVAEALANLINPSMQRLVYDVGQLSGIGGLFLAKCLAMVFYNNQLSLTEQRELRPYRYWWVIMTIVIGVYVLGSNPRYNNLIEVAKAMLPDGRDPAESFLFLALGVGATATYALSNFAPIYLLTIWREDDLTDRLLAAETAAKATDDVAGEIVFTEEEMEEARRMVEMSPGGTQQYYQDRPVD